MRETKKICLAIHSMQVGGMERVMSELAFYFCLKDSLEVHMILFGRTPEIFYDLPSKLIVHLPSSPFINSIRPIATFGRMLFLRKAVCRISPDTVLSFGEQWNSFLLLALCGLKYPIFISDR